MSSLVHLKSNYAPSMETSDYCTPDFWPDKISLGGGRSHVFAASEVLPFVYGQVNGDNKYFTFVDYVDVQTSKTLDISEDCVIAAIPLLNLVPHIPVRMAIKVGCHHKISIGSHVPKNQIVDHFAGHQCIDCLPCVGIYKGREKLIVHTKSSIPQTSSDHLTPVCTGEVEHCN